MCNFHDPNLVTFYLCIYLTWMKNTLLITYSTNTLVRWTVLPTQKSENVRSHSSNSVENATHYNHSSRENATPSSGKSPLAYYKEVPRPRGFHSNLRREWMHCTQVQAQSTLLASSSNHSMVCDHPLAWPHATADLSWASKCLHWIKALYNIGGTLLSNHTHFLRNLISESHKNSDLQTFVIWRNRHGKLEHRFLHRIQGKFNMFCNLNQICNQLKKVSRFYEGKKFSTLFNWTASKHEVQTIKMIEMAK